MHGRAERGILILGDIASAYAREAYSEISEDHSRWFSERGTAFLGELRVLFRSILRIAGYGAGHTIGQAADR